ncbi:MAG: IS1 family transposase, partial [Rhodobacteraceae bacterium]|nr:IS1 family transposase [Paracoccaceae bacterium]
MHSQVEKRYICDVCQKTFSQTKGTLLYRLRTDAETVFLVLTLLAWGCPLKAVVQAFGFHEKTVKEWWRRSGEHCRVVHEHAIGQSQLDLQQVQSDELKVKAQGGSFWMALAMMVPTRLWLGGAVSPHRDRNLIQALADQIRQIALCRPLLLAVDGLASYVKAFQRAFRTPLKDGSAGRPRLISWPDIAIVQVVKRRTAGQMSILRRIVQGAEDMITKLIEQTQGGGVINTAFIERLNATFRQRLAPLARRTRHLAQKGETLMAGMFTVGCFYNFCDNHHSLRVKLFVGERGHRWVQRTPAMAAGLTDHRWTAEELFLFKVPPPRWEPPKRRGRPSKAL